MESNFCNVIYWNNYSEKSYLWGSTIKFLENKEVYFKNIVANTGIVIKEWRFSTNYQSDKIVSELPILEENIEYLIELNCNEIPINTAYLRINFYDFYDDFIDCKILKNKIGKITIPEKTYKYDIQLFSAGLKELTFKNLKIKKIIEPIESKEKLINKNEDYNVINIILKQPSINSETELDNNLLSSIENIYIYSNNFLSRSYYLDISSSDNLNEIIREYSNYNINFIGYTPLTNIAAVYYGIKYESNVYIVDDFSDKKIYDNLIYDNFGNDIYSLNKKNKLKLYKDKLGDSNDLNMFRNIIDYSYRLKFVFGDNYYG